MYTMEHSSIDIKLKKFDRVYRPQDTISGCIIVNAYKGWPHVGVKLLMEGKVYLNSSGRGAGILDAMSANLTKPTTIFRDEIDVLPPGKFADGVAEVPFEFVLSGTGFLESYHGVFVSIIYSITATCDRGVMKKALVRDMEFIVEVPNGKMPESPPIPFEITPESLDNVNRQELGDIPRFKISGKLHRAHCPISLPFTGEVTVEVSDAPIRTIELQLIRVESVSTGSVNITRESTEIQSIQIGEGNICRNMVVPMYMIFPRLYSCPTLIQPNFRIEFEVNLVMVLGDGYMITENFPITLIRES